MLVGPFYAENLGKKRNIFFGLLREMGKNEQKVLANLCIYTSVYESNILL